MALQPKWTNTQSNGDATCNYTLTSPIDKDFTFRELLDYILSRGEWGSVYRGRTFDKILEYNKAGQVAYDEKNWNEKYLDRIVNEVTANGGWSKMDYFVTFKPYKVKARRIKNGERI